MGPASRKRSYRHALSGGRIEKYAVASNHDDVWITDPFCRREVDRVIPAQSTSLSQLASADSEGMIDLDEVDHFEQESNSVTAPRSCRAVRRPSRSAWARAARVSG